ncbi:hypothetical protein Bra5_PA00115 (plasmid) [Rhizobium phaseoli Brasil 5]|nr:hypothetical protein Bra5_PA00115 [Rhizobium phaseoli Brasil 5]
MTGSSTCHDPFPVSAAETPPSCVNPQLVAQNPQTTCRLAPVQACRSPPSCPY